MSFCDTQLIWTQCRSCSWTLYANIQQIPSTHQHIHVMILFCAKDLMRCWLIVVHLFYNRAAGGLVDAGSQYEKVLEEEIAKLQRLYGGGDLTSFPNFKFTGNLTVGYLVFSYMYRWKVFDYLSKNMWKSFK